LTERDHSIGGIVADVRAAAKSDARARAPIGDDGHFVGPESRVVGGNIADPAEPNAGGRADIGAGGQMEHQPVDPVMVLADFLDQQVGAR
jgi:hypothetical protein